MYGASVVFIKLSFSYRSIKHVFFIFQPAKFPIFNVSHVSCLPYFLFYMFHVYHASYLCFSCFTFPIFLVSHVSCFPYFYDCSVFVESGFLCVYHLHIYLPVHV